MLNSHQIGSLIDRRPRWLVASALAALLLLIAACDNDDPGDDATATTTPDPTASQTASPTTIVTPTATDEPDDPLRPPGAATGIDGVDRVIEAVLDFDGDYEPLEALIGYTEIGCTLALGGGGPPKCWDVPGTEQVEGTPVEVFAFSVCESEWEPRSDGPVRVLGMLVEGTSVGAASPEPPQLVVYGVYAVARVAEPSVWPSGEHAVVFAAQADGTLWGTTVRITDGRIVSMEFGCGATYPAAMAAGFEQSLLEPPVGGLMLQGEGVIEVIERLEGRDVEETFPRWAVVLDLETSVSGYRSVLVDLETRVVDSDGAPVSLDALELGREVAVSGIPLPWSLWRATEVVIGDE